MRTQIDDLLTDHKRHEDMPTNQEPHDDMLTNQELHGDLKSRISPTTSKSGYIYTSTLLRFESV